MISVAIAALALFQEKITLKEDGERFTPSGVIGTDGSMGKYESGQINDIYYLIYLKDADATFSTNPIPPVDSGINHKVNAVPDLKSMWFVDAQRDIFNDTVAIHVFKGDLMVSFVNDDIFVGIGSKNYPGEGIALRLDDDKPISSRADDSFGFETSKEIVDGLTHAKRVRTRFTVWPEKFLQDGDYPTAGFSEAWLYEKWLRKQIK